MKKKKNLDKDYTLKKKNYNLHKIKPKWIIDLSVKFNTVKVLEYNTGANLDDIGIVMTFKMQY